MRVPSPCSVAAGTAVVSVLGHKWSQLTGPRSPWMADRTRTPALHCGAHDLGRAPGRSLSVQVEALLQADAPAEPAPTFPISGRAAGPMRTSSKRAPCRSELRDRLPPAGCPPTYKAHHTEWSKGSGERAPTLPCCVGAGFSSGRLRACAFGGSVCRGGYGRVLVAVSAVAGRRWRSAWGAGGVAALGARGSGPGQWQGFGLRGGLGRDLAGGLQESGQGGVGVVCCPSDLEGELVPHDGDKPDTG